MHKCFECSRQCIPNSRSGGTEQSTPRFLRFTLCLDLRPLRENRTNHECKQQSQITHEGLFPLISNGHIDDSFAPTKKRGRRKGGFTEGAEGGGRWNCSFSTGGKRENRIAACEPTPTIAALTQEDRTIQGTNSTQRAKTAEPPACVDGQRHDAGQNREGKSSPAARVVLEIGRHHSANYRTSANPTRSVRSPIEF